MEKISGILHGSPRLMSVDMKEAAPIRPGTPSFGRPQGVSSLKDVSNEIGMSTAQRAINVQDEMSEWRAKDAKHAALAADISDRFFGRKAEVDERPIERPIVELGASPLRGFERSVESRPAGFKTDRIGGLRAASVSTPAARAMIEDFDQEAEEPMELEQPEGIYPRGSFIDRVA